MEWHGCVNLHTHAVPSKPQLSTVDDVAWGGLLNLQLRGPGFGKSRVCLDVHGRGGIDTKSGLTSHRRPRAYIAVHIIRYKAMTLSNTVMLRFPWVCYDSFPRG